MGSMSLPHLIFFGVVILVLFGGRGKISEIMGDVAKGVRSFKKGLSEEDEPKVVTRPSEPPRSLDHYSSVEPAASRVDAASETRR
jgi:sec-independent protein translocase protein TatA